MFLSFTRLVEESLWLDGIRWRIEDGHKLEDFKQDVIMLLSDKERFITYFTLLAEKR